MKSLLALAVFGSGVAFAIMRTPAPQVVLGSYATPLEDRVKGQRVNANLALEHFNGIVIGPGEEFSFNQTVGTWSRDQGYKKAPVSFNGQLIWTWGGGVCQTSSTLYNAALLAGMEILERNRHRFAPGYITPGRDAAVAYSNVDLRFRNPYTFPVTIRARISDDHLLCEITGSSRPKSAIRIVTEMNDVRAPKTHAERRNGSSGQVLNPGKNGFSVTTYRVFRNAQGERRQLLSVDNYPPMDRIIEHGR